MLALRLNILVIALTMLPYWASAACDRSLSQYRLQAWQTDDGLPLDAVYAIAQTPDRFLWVATEDGLARFDGAEFQRVELAPVLDGAPEFIQSLAVTAEGQLLAAGVSSGVISLGAGVPEFLPLESPARHLLQTENDTLWMGSRSDGVRVWPAGGTPTTIAGTRSPQISALAPRRDGGIWIGYADAGVQYVQDQRVADPAPGDALLRELSVLSLLEGASGTLWIGAREGLYRRAEGAVERVPDVDGAVGALLEDASGRIWIGLADGGIGRLCDDAGIDWLLPEDGLPAGPVKALFQDADDSVWIGLHGGGLVQLASGAALPITAAQGLPERPVLPLLQTRDGSTWIGTFGGGLVRYDGRAMEIITERDGLASDWVFSLSEGDDGELWVGTREGVSRLRNGSPDTVIGAESRWGAATAIAILHEEDGLWIGSTQGLARWQNGEVREYAAASEPIASAVTQIFRRRNGALLVATDGDGIYRLENDVLERPGYNQDLPSPLAYAFHEQENGVLWVLTARGILRHDSGQSRTVTAANGLPDPQVFSMLDDGIGYFWFSGNRGVFRVARDELQAVAEAGGQLLSTERFSAADGMPRSETNGGFQPTAWRGADGRLWYPTSDGVAVFDPRALPGGRTRIPRVHVDAVQAGDEALPGDGIITLSPNPPPLRFEYTAPEYLYPQRVNYRYRMRGVENAWYPASERQALYHGLPAGDFTFEVQARINRGPWSPSTARAVSVERHVLEMPLFWGVLALSGLAAAGALYHLHQQRRRRRELRQQQAQKLESIGLLASGVAHDFNNVLQGIISGAEALQLRVAEDGEAQREIDAVLDAADQGVGLSRQLLTFARQQPGRPVEVSLRGELERASSLLRRLVPASMEFDIDASEDVGTCVIDPVQFQQVLLNLVSNARDATPEGGRIRVELVRGEKGWAHVRVIDSGAGISSRVRDRIFEPFFTTKEAGRGTGLGLSVSYGIVEDAGGHIDVASRPGAGTVFSVVLPVATAPAAGAAANAT